MLVIECKNCGKDEAIALGVDQIRRYHRETPELFIPQMVFTATESIGFSYGVTWNLVRRNIFAWKDSMVGNLEAKVKSFCAIPHILSLLKNYIVFAEKDEELNKYILRQHQTAAVEKVVDRALDMKKMRGLVWHTQGSGKTFTMIKAAELLFKAQEAEKPTILLMIDRNELEDQMLKNLASLGIYNVEHANRIEQLNQLLRQDYRGIIVTTIQKFRDMPEKINTRKNIYVFIDEAHRTTGGDLGNYLMAGLPNATYIGYTGTPIDKTAYGKGTFKTFGLQDDKGYLHKYSIAESIDDGTTLPLFYALASNDLLVPHEILEKEFLSLAEAEGVADIEELNKILERAIKEYKEIEMLYEIVSPDAFLRPYLDDYATLSAIYAVVRKAYTNRIYVDCDFQKKTNELVQSKIDISFIKPVGDFFEINSRTVDYIKSKGENDNTKIINLVKTIEKIAEDESTDPYLIMLSERARAVQEQYEDRQITTQAALDELLALIEENTKRKQEQIEKGFDGLTFFVYRTLLDAKVPKAEEVSRKIKQAFVDYPNWKGSERELRELRKKVTFVIYAEREDEENVTGLVEELFSLLGKAYKI